MLNLPQSKAHIEAGLLDQMKLSWDDSNFVATNDNSDK